MILAQANNYDEHLQHNFCIEKLQNLEQIFREKTAKKK